MLLLNLLSPERKLFEQKPVEEITLQASVGMVQILPEHAPLIGELETGIFHFKDSNQKVTRGVISFGHYEIVDNCVNVFAETVELENEIDINRAKKAEQSALEALSEADLTEHQFKKYQQKLFRALTRLSFFE
jgi:F-type H+-transporting ATPase subunit epsilon